MNRKLQHTIQALAATAAVFSLMLIAGGPAPMPAPAPMATPAALLVVSAEAATQVEALKAEQEEAEGTQARQGTRRQRRSHATALPYFSFAQGLRQVTGS
ncbi:MAG TPA: hypothetical protein VFK18_00645 [Luteimonas sp.]|nr:hypothetical protein [Luteimonas sp.]